MIPIVIAILCMLGHLAIRGTRKPIYDRWVAQHGTDPDQWPFVPKSDRISKKRTKSESPSKPEKYGFVALIILAVAVIAYSNLK